MRRFHLLWIFFVVGILAIAVVQEAFSDPLVWTTPYGTVGLPFTATEVLLGYDGILKQAIGGASVPFYTDPNNIIALSVGAVAPWPNPSGSTIEPYLGIGHDILKEIPVLKEFQSAHLNIFGRYASTQGGRFGAGISISYAFMGGTLSSPPSLVATPSASVPSQPVPNP